MSITERVKQGLIASGGEVFAIGKSECGNAIMCAHKGNTRGRQIIVTAAIHARECYTALVVTEQAKAFIGKSGGAYFIPLVNPDGARFFESGETFGKNMLARNADKRYLWKANADGVDLNVNFDANWGGGKSNKLIAGASDYIGAYPLCAAESRALAAFTEAVSPAATISYHCMGGELYWEYGQDGKRRERDGMFAAKIAERIGVKKVDGHLFSAGGYKDFCVQKLGIPAVTVELIDSGSHPFFADAYARDIERNKFLIDYALDLLDDKE